MSHIPRVASASFDFVITEQLRVPLRLVGIYAPTAREDLRERVIIDVLVGNTVTMRYFSKWEWQPGDLGVTYEFKTSDPRYLEL